MNNTQILALQEEYERMQAFIESRPASTYALNQDNYNARLRELDAQIDAAIDAETPKTKAEIKAAEHKATCGICTIADVMKVCCVCVFRSVSEPETIAEAISAMEIGTLYDMTAEEQKEWFAGVSPIPFQ